MFPYILRRNLNEIIDIIIPLEGSDNPEIWKKEAAKSLGIPADHICDIRLRKHSIDARKRLIKIHLRLEVSTDSQIPDEDHHPRYSKLKNETKSVIIIGCGPAGMFAALRCVELGLRPIILERGKDASSRRFDLAPLLRKGTVIEDSNYCFGEGGAGTFSDGKLYTRAKKRGPVADIYKTLVGHGAPSQILVDAHPHVGSNLLPNVVMAMRKSILEAGGQVHFQTKAIDFIIKKNKIYGVRDNYGKEHLGEAVILATGHSARDIYSLLADKKIKQEAKPFAVGMRIEHPQKLIDEFQYHLRKNEKRPRLLPAARYRLATKIKDRGIHSFCMCPGGFIVPAATEDDEVVVNGMSLSRRDSEFANSGLVVSVEPEDVREYANEHGVMAGVAFQKNLESNAKVHGGGGQQAPAQRALDFVLGKDSIDLPKTSYFPGIQPARLDQILPEWMTWRIRKSLKLFHSQMKGYLGEEANLLGFETRTSSPIRIPRDPDTLEHTEIKGLFPCGEGAGFAGGIVSAALDGIRSAEAAKSLCV